MNKIILYVLVCLLLVSSVLAVDKRDFVQLVENTDHCFDCHTIYKVTKAGDISLTKFGVDFTDAKGEFVIPDYEVSYLVTEDYTELVNEYKPCLLNQTIIDNETGLESVGTFESQCFVGQKEVQKKRQYYAPVSLQNLKDWFNTADVGKEFYIKISGHLNRGEAVDNILVLNDFVYDEYAWWNASFQFRMNISCLNVSDGLPVIINGSGGFKINDNTQIVWTNCQNNSGLAVYYNNYSDYVTANDTNQRPFEVESGNGSGYNPSQVWDDYALVYHFNNSAQDSKGTFNGTLFGSPTFISNGIIGGGVRFDGTDDWINITKISNLQGNGSWVLSSTILFFARSRANGTSHTYNGVNPLLASSPSAFFYALGVKNGGKIHFRKYHYNNLLYGINSTSIPAHNSTFLLTVSWNNTGSDSIGINNSIEVNSTGYDLQTNIFDYYHIGRGAVLAANYFNGDIGEFRIINKQLTASEINQIYQNYLGTQGYGSLSAEEESVFLPANESLGREAIVAGLDSSEITESYTAYSDKQVYIRLMNGSQYKGTFDEFVVSGNKRWAFNYDQNSSTSFPTMFNITPVFYVWQKYNLTYDQIKLNISAFINSTYP